MPPDPNEAASDWEDPIVREVHETRARLLARFGGDFSAYMRYIRSLEEQDRKRGIEYVSTPPRRRRKEKPNAA